jgi:hypothetical protein
MQFGCWGKLRGRPKKRLEYSIMMDLQEVGCEDLRRMDLDDDIVRCGDWHIPLQVLVPHSLL